MLFRAHAQYVLGFLTGSFLTVLVMLVVAMSPHPLAIVAMACTAVVMVVVICAARFVCRRIQDSRDDVMRRLDYTSLVASEADDYLRGNRDG